MENIQLNIKNMGLKSLINKDLKKIIASKFVVTYVTKIKYLYFIFLCIIFILIMIIFLSMK
jgi:hypothetical protein